MITTIPLREKSWENPYTAGIQRGKGVLEDTFSVPGQFRTEPAKAPTQAGLICQKEPD